MVSAQAVANRVCSKRLSSPTVRGHLVRRGLSTSVHVYAPKGVGTLVIANGCTDGFFLDMQRRSDVALVRKICSGHNVYELERDLRDTSKMGKTSFRDVFYETRAHGTVFFISKKTIMGSSKSLFPSI